MPNISKYTFLIDIPLQEPTSISASISDVSVHGRPAGATSTPPPRAETPSTSQPAANANNSPAQASNSNSQFLSMRKFLLT